MRCNNAAMHTEFPMIALLREFRAWLANPTLELNSIPASAFQIVQPMI
jgi:hypothetical protein